MFKLIRRISVGVIPRPDRPWDEDPTSNAPRTSRKRRLGSAERDDDDQGKAGKKVRADTASPSVADPDAPFLVPTAPEPETKEVKEVTQGVKEVELEDKPESVTGDAAPESIPLPEETSGELDEPAEDGVDDNPSPADSDTVSGAMGSDQVAVGQSTSTPVLPKDYEGRAQDEEIKGESTPDVTEPNDASAQQDHP